jgi:hypothetical protein
MLVLKDDVGRDFAVDNLLKNGHEKPSRIGRLAAVRVAR